MSTYSCPKGCESTDPEWCSECGAGLHPPIASHANNDAIPQSLTTSVVCPDCGTPRDNADNWCGVCRYNYITCTSYQANVALSPDIKSASIIEANAAAAIATAPPATATLAVVPATNFGDPKGVWNIVIEFDPTIDPTVDASITPRPLLTFPLDIPTLFIGRKNAKNHPEIPIDDEGVSSRHATIRFTPDGTPIIFDLNSTNGTVVNDKSVEPGVATPIKSGDVIKIGRWTRITIAAQ